MKYKNTPADLSINYKVKLYNKLDELFDLKDGEIPTFHFMLALMGLKQRKKIDLSANDNSGEKRDFSLRTVYPRNESELDSYYGILSILDNLDLSYNEVIEKIAFERTEINGSPFLKMTNVKTFYEYMLGGLDYFEDKFLMDGNDAYRIAQNLHSYLIKDDQDLNDILIEIMTTEENSL